ncbi:TetR/AcrR family transcriptional regulator [Streptomyces sp. NPDC058739]|uniref:TetR/AcrR family transcriptional regulator n=1 Tax=Streptomyces sp. NPDC058739 TaxID=3346618 RepID=UPI003693CC88
MVRPKTHDEALRQRLIHRAAATVFDRGVAALSLRQLAADVKTSTTAVYSLFGNKAGLLDSLFQEATRLFVAHLGAVQPTADPADDVVRLGLAYREYALANPHLYGILFSDPATRFGAASREDSGGDAVETYRPLVDAVRRGQEDGRFTGHAAAEAVALFCWGTAHGLVSLELAGQEAPGLTAEAGYERTLRAVVEGWRVPAAAV